MGAGMLLSLITVIMHPDKTDFRLLIDHPIAMVGSMVVVFLGFWCWAGGRQLKLGERCGNCQLFNGRRCEAWDEDRLDNEKACTYFNPKRGR